jgi:hypothetical protein
LIEEAEMSGVKLGVIFQDRLKPGIRRMKELVDRRFLGSPILADALVKWYRPPEYYSFLPMAPDLSPGHAMCLSQRLSPVGSLYSAYSILLPKGSAQKSFLSSVGALYERPSFLESVK